jgi:GxxExxY protein
MDDRKIGMPIQPPPGLRRLEDREFQQVTYEVMEVIFKVHNEMGRLFDEPVYQRAVAHRIEGALIEVPVRVSFESFVKEYYLDLLVRHGALFEFKVAEATHDRHRGQLLNYLLLLQLPHGKLVNFRNELVEHEFVNAPLTRDDRIHFHVDDSGYDKASGARIDLREMVVRILRDWGMGLDLYLYEEALAHFFGGAHRVIQPVEILDGGARIANQKLPVILPGTGLKLTAFSRDLEAHEDQLRRFLRHTALDRIQWVNVGRKVVMFRTLCQSK